MKKYVAIPGEKVYTGTFTVYADNDVLKLTLKSGESMIPYQKMNQSLTFGPYVFD